MQARKCASDIHPDFETQGRRHQKSKNRGCKTGALQKGHVSSNKASNNLKSSFSLDKNGTRMDIGFAIQNNRLEKFKGKAWVK